MLSPLNRAVVFKANKYDKDENGKYVDPLMRWPLRAASYTNGAGEVLRPFIGNYATLGWVPVLMYIGADIYDKYKNNENEYSPSSRRFLKQAVYQGVSTFLLPIITTRIGQDVFSLFGRLSQHKLDFNTQEKISKMAETYIANGRMQESSRNADVKINDFMEIVYNNLDFKRQEENAKNPVKNVIHGLEKWFDKITKSDKKSQIDKYAKKTIEDLISTQELLTNPTTEFKTGKLYGNYIANLKDGQTENIAKRSTLRSYQASKMRNGKMLKTLGGFIAVILTIKPVDKLIDKIIFPKIINPGMEKIENISFENVGSRIRDTFINTDDDV